MASEESEPWEIEAGWRGFGVWFSVNTSRHWGRSGIDFQITVPGSKFGVYLDV